ncbi:MAG: YigZ family protein [Phaeodactylibacter sp.]|uniref:IMPACT family protein n=1 Tax=Phaeodactylibacter sp. TaxID=1940289 RepID=UPI0032EC35D0
MSTTKDTYQTISGLSTGEFRDRGSKFLAYAYPACNEDEWKAALEEVRKLHPKARHYCYAFRLGLDQNNFRANDDGEPSGTAGRPILGQIDSFGLTYVMVIVVRYFGGTLLGTSGLINAYKESTAAALQAADITARTVEEVYRLSFGYGLMGNVMSSIEHLQLNMIDQNFDTSATVDLAIRRSEVASTLLRLKAAVGNLYLEEVDEETVVEGLGIEWVETR